MSLFFIGSIGEILETSLVYKTIHPVLTNIESLQ